MNTVYELSISIINSTFKLFTVCVSGDLPWGSVTEFHNTDLRLCRLVQVISAARSSANEELCVQNMDTARLLLKLNYIYESHEFATKLEVAEKPRTRRRRHSLPAMRAVKFEINMADERNGVNGSSMSDVAGGDAGNGPLGYVDDTHLNSCSRRRPFLIGVGGGTASGKVYSQSTWLCVRRSA